MPKAKGSPKSGGRKKGSVNIKTLERQVRERVLASRKATPLEILMAAAHSKVPSGRGVTLDDKRWHMAYKVDAAKAAAPYFHPKLNAVMHGGSIGGGGAGTSNLLPPPAADANDPGLLEAARRIAFVMALGAKMAQSQKTEKEINPK
tara:strand:- start:27979 stop:28419 length:441 start_codon:yes stop_codon:yes gene_type:complete